MDVRVITKARGDQIEDASIISGAVNGAGRLILTTKGGTQIDAGLVIVPQKPSPVLNVFTASGTWTKPEGAVLVQVVGIGGGGGGGGGGIRVGGGGGGYMSTTFPAASFGASESVTIGAGGAGGAASGGETGDGEDGGATTFGTKFRVPGGFGGRSGQSSAFAGNSNGSDALELVSGVPAPTRIASGGGGSGGPPRLTVDSTLHGGFPGSAAHGGLAAGGTAGGNGGTLSGMYVGGGGGSGGMITANTPACTPGGNGGLYGGGGGAGVAKLSAPASASAGGNGAAGVCLVFTFF